MDVSLSTYYTKKRSFCAISVAAVGVFIIYGSPFDNARVSQKGDNEWDAPLISLECQTLKTPSIGKFITHKIIIITIYDHCVKWKPSSFCNLLLTFAYVLKMIIYCYFHCNMNMHQLQLTSVKAIVDIIIMISMESIHQTKIIFNPHIRLFYSSII